MLSTPPFFLIPARQGSKGLPFKNRKLFDLTAETIPSGLKKSVYVSTNDEVLKKRTRDYGFNVVTRPEELSRDDTSMRDVLAHFLSSQKSTDDSIVVLLYLTYPERTWEDIEKIYDFFLTCGRDSLICAEDVTDHPYLCFEDFGNGRAVQLIEHEFYRRQDYPPCIRQSMFVSCYKGNVINRLNGLMVEPDTYFFKLRNNKVDIDNQGDLDEYRGR